MMPSITAAKASFGKGNDEATGAAAPYASLVLLDAVFEDVFVLGSASSIMVALPSITSSFCLSDFCF